MRANRSRPATAICLLSYLAVAVACGGGETGTSPPPAPPTGPQAPTGLSYSVDPAFYRSGEPIVDNTAALAGGDAPTLFEVAPALPGGLALDPVSGTISGTPDSQAGPIDYTVTASNDAGSTDAMVTISVGTALPAAMKSLHEQFNASVVYEDAAPTPVKIAKMALATDGRLFFTEVDTGRIRVIDPAGGGLQVDPFATVAITTGGHAGLLGLALAPDFATSGHLYAMATVPAVGLQDDRMKIFRWTDVNNEGTAETTVLDDLPIAPPFGSNNGGEILFDPDGMLLVSIGDTQDGAAAQADTSVSLAGKVLRYDVSSGSAVVPATGNPFPGDPEWCRGLRNTFGMAIHPTAGGLFGTDNGPAADDELNFLQPGLNFEWENGTPPDILKGHTIKTYATVITPTALCWHTGVNWGTEWANNLFMATYTDHSILRFRMSGDDFTDPDAPESTFAEWNNIADDNHPLDVVMEPSGSLLVSTFTGIYRITKQ